MNDTSWVVQAIVEGIYPKESDSRCCQIHLQLFKKNHLDLIRKPPFFKGSNELKKKKGSMVYRSTFNCVKICNICKNTLRIKF